MANTAELIVETKQGLVRGRQVESIRGGIYYSFQGIPYAKPPVGNLRFKAPEPPEPWQGVRDALTEGSPAPAKHMLTQQYLEDSNEDCLFVNVYTPKVPGKKDAEKAVLFWIHGGGFSTGSGTTDMYGPDFLITEDVVVVTCNYRLGALGFLSLQNVACPGNNGLKDVVAALKWVQKNISAFGGDPNNVTIFGESAGGAAVQYLMLSKSTKGLFHKAISQSGVTLNPWAYADDPRERAFELGRLLGCDTKDENELLNFLQKASPKEIVLKTEEVAKRVAPKEYYVTLSFKPTVEPETDGAFLTKHPKEILRDGDYHQIPYMLGTNTLEGLIMLKPGEPVKKLESDEELRKLVPVKLQLELDEEKISAIVDNIRKFYFSNGFDELKLVNALSCIYFINGFGKSIEFRQKSKTPTYLYRFEYDGTNTLKKLLGKELPGTCHGDELGYLFYSSLLDFKPEKGTADYRTMEELTGLWTNFAKHGNPTPTDGKWKPISENSNQYLAINDGLTLKPDYEKEELDFWYSVYQIAATGGDQSKL